MLAEGQPAGPNDNNNHQRDIGDKEDDIEVTKHVIKQRLGHYKCEENPGKEFELRKTGERSSLHERK